ncbi:MAG: hypothetical protein ACFFD2_23065, partial [Promethearchaeota archaeon]
MSNEDFLRGILNGQNLTQNQIENLKNQSNAIVRIIVEEIGGNLTKFNGGSYAKGTMIRASYDLDVVLFWPYNFQYSPQNLYSEVGSVLQRNGWNPRSKKVGWEIPFPGDFHIDVIPGKRIMNQRNYGYLYNRNLEKRFRTSVKKQVNFVKKTKRQDTIRLMKLWKKRKNVPIKTFILEDLVIKGCKGLERSSLEPQVIASLDYISRYILTKRVVDVSNSNNVVTDDLTTEVK